MIKCRIMRHFIWVFTICQSTRLGVSDLQSVTQVIFKTELKGFLTFINGEKFSSSCCSSKGRVSVCLDRLAATPFVVYTHILQYLAL